MELRDTFDTVADLYATARPSYPEEIVERVPRGRVLEVACGGGQLTKQLVARGDDVTCVELGANLARVAQREVPRARVIKANFETWQVDTTYDVLACATAWSWIAPVKYAQAQRALRPDGRLAIIAGGHAFPDDTDPFFFRIQDAYHEIGEPRVEEWPTPDSYDTQRLTDEMEHTGWLRVVDVHTVLQELRYTADSYIEVLKTFSGHILMTDAQRETIFAAVRRLAGDGEIRKHMLVSVHVARRVA